MRLMETTKGRGGEHSEMETVTTVAQVHRAMTSMAEGGESPAAPTHKIIRSKSFKKKKKKPMVYTVINLEEITEAPITEPGYDEGGANSTHKKNTNVERRPRNEQVQGEVTPG